MPATVEPAVEMPYPTHAPAWAERFGEDDFGIFAGFRVGEVGFLFRWIPSGRFSMGSAKTEEGRWDDEGPVHDVVIRTGFWMGQTPVTQAQWKVVMATDPSYFKGEDRPVEQVSWEEAVQMAAGLSERFHEFEGRLPTEAEWEYACRAGTTTRWSFGDDEAALEQHGWYDKNSGRETHPVGLKRGNPWGLKDMHGGVLEWCLDWLGGYSEGQAIDPKGPETGSNRVFRGGSWHDSARFCRSAYRGGDGPGRRGILLGFRLVLAPRSVF
jgi:formylglycine-generating enzyme required for sulfatase activity